MKYYKRITAIFLSVVSLLLCACGGTVTAEPTPEPTAEPLAFSDDPNAITEASANVVMLTTYDKNGEIYMTGSGFPAFEDGYMVTNYHVIEGADRIEGNTESEMYFKIDEIVAADTDRDIAILKTNAKTGLTQLTLGDTTTLQKGEKVVAIGSPLGLINTVSDGMYSNRRTEDGQEYLQFTAAISPGSSGGALFNDKGEVIGITSASYTEGQNLNLAIPSEVVQEVWEHKGDERIEVECERDWITVEEFYNDYYGELSETEHGTPIKAAGYVSSKFRYNLGAGGYLYEISIVDDKDDVMGFDFSDSTSSSHEKSDAGERENSRNHIIVMIMNNLSKPKETFESIGIGDFIIANLTFSGLNNCRLESIESIDK